MVSGFGGCNQYNAPYTVANGLLIVRSRPVSTMMACNPEAMRLEQDFLDGLTRITSSTLDNTGNPRRLTLLLSSGDTLDFGRRIDPATGGQMGPKSSCTSIPSGCPAMPAPAAPCATRCATARPSPGSSGMAISPASISSRACAIGCAWSKCAIRIRRPMRPAKWVLDAVVEQEPVRR